MGFQGADHVTLAVQDVAAAEALLAHLGFERTHTMLIDGGEPAVYMGMPDMVADHITLSLAGAHPPFEVQLLHFHGLDGEVPYPEPSNHHRLGFNHLALRVDDLSATAAALIAAGVEPLSEEMDYIARKLRFFAGPEGTTLELVERLDGT